MARFFSFCVLISNLSHILFQGVNKMRGQEIERILSRDIRQTLQRQSLQYDKLQEIRLRIGRPLMMLYANYEWIFEDIVKKESFQETLEYISNYSLYAYENELKQGFITIEGGHRVGMAGQVVIENGKVKNLKQISSMNIRVAHEVLNCADIVFPYIAEGRRMCHTLIISPPRCGKTTLLRDIIRQISNGNRWIKGCTVGVVDERSEIGGCYMGVPQNQIGIRTDILDCCPKAEGMLMLIRAMSPDVIAVDEIGSPEDVHALEYAMHCGCKMIATVHGRTMEEIRKKPLFEELVKMHRFERYIVLGNRQRIGEIEGIYDARGSLLFKEA